MNLLILKEDVDTRITNYYDNLKRELNNIDNANIIEEENLENFDNGKIETVVVIANDIFKFSKLLEEYKKMKIPIYIVLTSTKSNVIAKSVNITNYVFYISKSPKKLVERIFLRAYNAKKDN